MADNGCGIVLILLQELVRAGEGDLVDVLIDFFGGHANATVANRERAGFLVEADAHRLVAHLALELALHGKCLELARSVDGVAHQLAEKDFMVAVKKFLDNRKNVLGSDTNVTFLHSVYSFVVYKFFKKCDFSPWQSIKRA